MTSVNDQELNNSVRKLNDTAASLVALMQIVDKNQTLLLENREVTEANTGAISLRSTKAELLKEVDRLAVERKKDRTKTKLTVGGSFFISLLLILAIFLTTSEYKKARNDANTQYAQSAQSICEQRGQTFDAIQKWIEDLKALLIQDKLSNPALKPKRLAAYDNLLKSFPDVDCSIGSSLTSMNSMSSIDKLISQAQLK